MPVGGAASTLEVLLPHWVSIGGLLWWSWVSSGSSRSLLELGGYFKYCSQFRRVFEVLAKITGDSWSTGEGAGHVNSSA
jgi:hypothetical protein